MKKVLCIGQVAYDITLIVDKFPLENKKMRIKEKVECAGGSAFNCAYLLNKWGIDTTFVGSIGNDYYGNMIIEECRKEKMKASLKKFNDKTTVSYIITNISNGSRTILTDKNKNINFYDYDSSDDFNILVLDSNEFELSKKMLMKYKNSISILDAGKLCDEVIELGKNVTYFVCSKDFAEDFTKIKLDSFDNYKKAYEIIKDNFKNNVIITLEDRGSFTKLDDYILVPSIKVNPVDSTGAGDIYHGALAYFILNNYKLDDAMRYANIAGAISTERIGSKSSQPSLNEVLQKGKENVI